MYVREKCVPLEFRPGETKSEGVLEYEQESLFLGIIKEDTELDPNFMAKECTNQSNRELKVVLF